jgi:hypothetical protein
MQILVYVLPRTRLLGSRVNKARRRAEAVRTRPFPLSTFDGGGLAPISLEPRQTSEEALGDGLVESLCLPKNIL